MEIGSIRTHTGVCDASAAVFVDGGREFLVANDEDQQLTMLRRYNAEEDGPPRCEYVLDPALLQSDAEDPEIDLEGSAWMNGRIYWIGSHSRNKAGKKRPSRHRLFSTEFRDGAPTIVGAPYCTLLRDVERSLGLKLDAKLSPKLGGVSIESLAATANPGELLIGVRSPLIDHKALVLPLRNAEAVVHANARPWFGVPMLLDLGGMGLRSMDYWPERKIFLLIAGPAGEGDETPRLMRWDGSVESKPEVIEHPPIDIDAAAEGLCIEPGSGTVYLLFDEGNRIVDGVRCKDSDHKSFRSVSLRGL